MIVGGGPTANTGIMKKFIELAGGPKANLVIVPTAAGNKAATGKIKVYKEEDVVAGWKKRGVTQVRMLHTHDREIANTEAFTKPLRAANAVWFNGGRQWNIVDSYMDTLTYREFHKVLKRGGVIGGSSAGATIQGDYLVRGAVAGPHIVMPLEKEHQHLQFPSQDSHRSARRHARSLGRLDPRDQAVSQAARYRALRRNRHRGQGRSLRGAGEREGGDPRQSAAVSGWGKALLSPFGWRRL